MEYWSEPIPTGINKWTLTNTSGMKLTVTAIRSTDDVTLPFLTVVNGLGPTFNPGDNLQVCFRATSLITGFNGLILSGIDEEERPWTVQYPTRSR